VLFYWSLVQGPTLESRDDNPRLVEEALRIERGRILDRNDAILAETAGEPGQVERLYQEPIAPVVGYYSLRHGVAGIESSYDDVLSGRDRGPWIVSWEELLHRNPRGRDVQLTLDAELQALANRTLGERAGSIVLLDAHTGDVIVVTSQPGYDPNRLDEEFETLNDDSRAPLLNRATQAVYQPGSAIQPLLLAAGIEDGLVDMGGVVDRGTQAIPVDGVIVRCAVSPYGYEPTLVDAMRYACPAPFAELAGAMGSEQMVEVYSRFGLTGSLELPLAIAGATAPQLDSDEALRAEATGQGEFTVSPLQLAWAVTAIANEGMRLPLRLVRRIGSDQGGWEIVVPSSQSATESMDRATAEAVALAMRGAFPPGLGPVQASDRIAAHVGLAISGPGNAYDSWFLGFAPLGVQRTVNRYVVVVLLERTDDLALAAEIGVEMLLSATR
jgi:peptidoglycan glycosyltransferase